MRKALVFGAYALTCRFWLFANLAYQDKNHAGILIIRDRLFGTFEPEHQRLTYGLTTSIGLYNPMRIAFHDWTVIGKDVCQAELLRNAVGSIFGLPGWSYDGSRKTARQLRAEVTPRPVQPLATQTYNRVKPFVR